ncbi:hypothetical protein [Acinetobacter colistiniresistens]|uniref:hypothetical protein n=1 Tax=Acinetobacter colistiniresistens TaxID=280145 RepID=UPI00124F7FA4|nr:hypothetical protein [Acinetobacter colistiniresistens]
MRNQEFWITLTDISLNTRLNVCISKNSNYVKFRFSCLKQFEVELKTADYLADLSNDEDSTIETIGISKKGYKKILKEFS